MNRSIWKFVYWIIISLALCGLASQLYPVLVDYFNAEIKAIPYSASIDYGEGPLLDQTLRMSKFENIELSAYIHPRPGPVGLDFWTGLLVWALDFPSGRVNNGLVHLSHIAGPDPRLDWGCGRGSAAAHHPVCPTLVLVRSD